MPLPPGTPLGPYQILAPLGAGGMGEVYRARDTRLGRDVAIKVLPPHLAASPEVRARFEREARTISQLDHPHICTLFDVGRAPGEVGSGGIDYLVMELLEGETLAHRLEKGPLPVGEVLSIGTQIADALDRAHRAGVVHRDLKPGNVMLTKSGVKLMDFGLARTALAAAASGALTESPTVSRPLTAEGTIVGTFQYMAPEQLEGRDADARSDLWALGCVLYEMATGKRAFEGKSQASLIAAIMERRPTPPSLLVPLLPPALDQVVQQCLAKDPDERIQTAHDVKLELQWIASGGSQAGVPAPLAARRRSRERLAWAMAGILALAVVALGAWVLRPTPAPRVIRFEVGPPRGTTRLSWPRLSPDGKLLAFLATDSAGSVRIWVRSLDGIDAHPLDAVVGSARPFWSPDSRWLAFINDGKLMKVAVAGGPAISICDAPGGFDGTWGRSGWILFDGANANDSIRGAPASGGAPTGVTFLDRAHGETNHAWPFFLPDGRHFLFVDFRAGGVNEVRVGRLGSRDNRAVGRTDSRAEYAPPGYLVYESAGVLMAQRFDPRTARTRGDPVPVGDLASGSVGLFSVSSGGGLAFRPRGIQAASRLLWVDRNGHIIGEAAPPDQYEDVVLSPDGARVAVSIVGEQPSQRDIWVRDLRRGVSSRLTFDPGDEFAPVWSPDGNRIAYGALRGDEIHCYVRSAWGGAEDSLGRAAGFYEGPFGWSGAANILTISHVTATNHWDVYALSPEGRQPPRPLLQSPFNERAGRLSPDGRWLAYSSDESGRDEVYVVPYPGPGPKIRISTGGGEAPQWRGDGKELFFQGPDQSMLAADIRAGTTFVAGTPKILFRIPLAAPGLYRGYRCAPSPDGQRFLVNASSGEATAGRFIVATNWTSELKKK